MDIILEDGGFVNGWEVSACANPLEWHFDDAPGRAVDIPSCEDIQQTSFPTRTIASVIQLCVSDLPSRRSSFPLPGGDFWQWRMLCSCELDIAQGLQIEVSQNQEPTIAPVSSG